ncbi:MAG TPA: TIGR01777 family protein [Lutibacter sp.]|nr:TIGR01777 family protein [Lutibacter sp.]
METILIAGGTGLIGKHLSSYLKDKGYHVRLLSRNKTKNPTFPTYIWNITTGYIEKNALKDVSYIINLAGANIGSKRWTKKRKNEILTSRIESAHLLFKEVQRTNTKLKGYITASAIGFYGALSTDKIFNENDKHATDFLGNVCYHWEKASNIFEEKKIRTVQIRTGVVFTPTGGALEKMTQPIKLGFGATLGKGTQYMPWIHIADLCRLYEFALSNSELKGAYNAVVPSHITNKEFTQLLAKQLDKRIWLPNIPSPVLRILLGEMASIILYGSRVSSEKIIKMGFNFKYSLLSESLDNLILRKES